MCGIVAYLGSRSATPILIEGLKRLEYRGYDSAGVAVMRNDGLRVVRAVGRVAKLEEALAKLPEDGATLGLAHTRWATHGGVTQRNAHPQCDDQHGIAIVHNGIIENYSVLKTYMQEKGRAFQSDTDTEVIAMLISELYAPDEGIDLEAAVRAAQRTVIGAYAIAVICEHEPDTMLFAREASPRSAGVRCGAAFRAGGVGSGADGPAVGPGCCLCAPPPL